MLEAAGLDAVQAGDGVEGVELFRSRTAEISCLILGLTMPQMGGDAALREMQAIRSDVKVLLASGYDQREASDRFAGRGFAGFLQKPCTFEELIGKVREMIDG